MSKRLDKSEFESSWKSFFEEVYDRSHTFFAAEFGWKVGQCVDGCPKREYSGIMARDGNYRHARLDDGRNFLIAHISKIIHRRRIDIERLSGPNSSADSALEVASLSFTPELAEVNGAGLRVYNSIPVSHHHHVAHPLGNTVLYDSDGRLKEVFPHFDHGRYSNEVALGMDRALIRAVNPLNWRMERSPWMRVEQPVFPRDGEGFIATHQISPVDKNSIRSALLERPIEEDDAVPHETFRSIIELAPSIPLEARPEAVMAMFRELVARSVGREILGTTAVS